jgi:hypothetical protein
MDGPLRERARVLNPRRRSPLEPREDTDSQRLRRTLRPPQVRRQSRCYRRDARKSTADRDRAHEGGRVLSLARRRSGLVGAVDTPGRFLPPDSLLHGFVADERRRRARLVDRGGPQSPGRPGDQERWAAMAYGRCTRATKPAMLGHERQRRRRERCLGRRTRRGLQHRALPDRGRRAHLASHDSFARVTPQRSSEPGERGDEMGECRGAHARARSATIRNASGSVSKPPSVA